VLRLVRARQNPVVESRALCPAPLVDARDPTGGLQAAGMTPSAPTAVKSADRVLDLFEALARAGTGLSHTELSDELGIPKSSLTQLIRTLTIRTYLRFSAADKKYHLGEMFRTLARQTAQLQDLISLAEPLLVEIARETGESAALNMLEGDMSKVVATVSSSQRLVSHMRLGDLAPLYATSSGKALLAHFSDEQRDAYFANVELSAITPKTITSRSELVRQLERVRADRVADVFEEFTVGIVGIAVAILAPGGEPLGAINVAMPAIRYSSLSRTTIVDALERAVGHLEQRLERGVSD
jgi:DNA-binding IclR family transcriptional regulator